MAHVHTVSERTKQPSVTIHVFTTTTTLHPAPSLPFAKENGGEKKSIMARNLFVVATIAVACAVAAQAKSEYKVDNVAFTIDAACGQLGAAPANLTGDLPTGRGDTGYVSNTMQLFPMIMLGVTDDGVTLGLANCKKPLRYFSVRVKTYLFSFHFMLTLNTRQHCWLHYWILPQVRLHLLRAGEIRAAMELYCRVPEGWIGWAHGTHRLSWPRLQRFGVRN